VSDKEDGLSWRSRALLLLGTGALRILARTWRFQVINPEAIDNLRAAKHAFIFSLWHGQLLPLLWHHREEGVVLLISEHKDGEMVARAAESLGYALVRGSSTHGGDRALISVIRELQSGREVAITPDGPRGPARKYAPGALIAAQRSGAAILPVVAVADKAWRLRSWDEFMIPKPFARVTVAYGDPVAVLATTPRAAAAEGPRFEAIMTDTIGKAGG